MSGMHSTPDLRGNEVVNMADPLRQTTRPLRKSRVRAYVCGFAWSALHMHMLAFARAGCITDEDCSLLGVCGATTPSACACDEGWKGDDCGQLDLLPVTPGTGYNLTGQSPPVSSWGANIFPETQGSDTWHMYAAEFENGCDIAHWSPNSAVVHAVSSNGPAGPYVRAGVAIKPFSHNPKVVQAPDGTWLMYTIGTQLPESLLFNCTREDDENGKDKVDIAPPPPGRNPANRESNISLYTSNKLEGPWTKFGVILGPNYEGAWDEDTTNPSPYVSPSGEILLMYRGCKVRQPGCEQEKIGIASAKHWQGPYVRHDEVNPILPHVDAEDPSMWIDKRGHFHFLMHYIPDSVNTTRHAFSRNYTGPWQIHEASIPYSTSVEISTGGSVTYEKRERPHIVFSQAGLPEWLVTGVVVPEGQHGYNGKSFTLVQGIRSKASQ